MTRRPQAAFYYYCKPNQLNHLFSFTCSICGKEHQRLWKARRVALPTGLAAVAVRVDGQEKLLDPTVAMELDRPITGSTQLTDLEAAKVWHMESHYFGVPDPTPEQITGRKA